MWKKKTDRLDEENINYQGCLMKIVEYRNRDSITVEFQDEHKGKMRTSYRNYLLGRVKNPYYPSAYGVGILGTKYPSKENGRDTKEYKTWFDMLKRCYNQIYKEKHTTYINIICCEEWLLFENFYEWLHSQSNFDKWYKNDKWMLDKDILVKNNKIYSPVTCCLVPQNVNKLFTKSDAIRGKYPIGVKKHGNSYQATCSNQIINKLKHLGTYSTPEEAFYLGYKPYKENIIKEIAQIEFNADNITKECYEAMMNYVVEITD